MSQFVLTYETNPTREPGTAKRPTPVIVQQGSEIKKLPTVRNWAQKVETYKWRSRSVRLSALAR